MLPEEYFSKSYCSQRNAKVASVIPADIVLLTRYLQGVDLSLAQRISPVSVNLALFLGKILQI